MADVRAERKSAPWKVAVAAHMKRTTQASNGWLNEQLAMGSAVAVSQYISRLRHHNAPQVKIVRELIQRIKT